MKRFVYVSPGAGVPPEFVALIPSGYTPRFCADTESHTANTSVAIRRKWMTPRGE